MRILPSSSAALRTWGEVAGGLPAAGQSKATSEAAISADRRVCFMLCSSSASEGQSCYCRRGRLCRLLLSSCCHGGAGSLHAIANRRGQRALGAESVQSVSRERLCG